MNFTLSEEQRLIADNAERFLSDHSDSEAVRRVMESEEDFDAELWRRIREEMGWPALHIPESCGGLGLGYVELALIFELSGYHLLCSPLFSSIALAANALLVSGDEAKMKEYLPDLASGEKTAALAWLPADAAHWSAAAGGLESRKKGGDFALDGELGYVLNGASADFFVVAAGEAMFVVPSDVAGLSVRRLPTMDQTRPLARLRFDDVRVGAERRLEAESGETLRRTSHLARAALAAEQAGGARRCLDMAVAYARERKQFGRAIGSFQAIKHKCADMMLEVESMRSAAWYAACIADNDLHEAAADGELAEAAALAKCFCSEGFFRCAAENIQLHGGVGFSWEYDPHLYFKRARGGESQFGTPSQLRAEMATRLFEDQARWN